MAATMEHPPIYTMDDDDLRVLKPRMKADDPRRIRSCNRLRTQVFASTSGGRYSRHGQRYETLRLIEKPRRDARRHYYQMVAQNVQGVGPDGVDLTERYPPDMRFRTATIALSNSNNRVVIPLEIVEAYRAKINRSPVSGVVSIFIDLLHGLNGVHVEEAEAHRCAMYKMIMDSSDIRYLASPPVDARPASPCPDELLTFGAELRHRCHRCPTQSWAKSDESFQDESDRDDEEIISYTGGVDFTEDYEAPRGNADVYG